MSNLEAAGARAPQHKFGGTIEQIKGRLAFYKVMSWITGTMLLLLCAEMILKYVFNAYLFLGGTVAATGEPFGAGFGLADPLYQAPWQSVMGDLPEVAGGFNLSVAVLIVHGWCYVVYLLADFRLWSVMRWPFKRFLLIALGGVVPLLSFIMERSVHKDVEEIVAANPQAARRY